MSSVNDQVIPMLEHMPDPAVALKAIHRVLRPGSWSRCPSHECNPDRLSPAFQPYFPGQKTR
jgi:ubiquinone/menaquinone biosynthesis C-methylase UbiE